MVDLRQTFRLFSLGGMCHSILWNPLLKYEGIPKVSVFVWTVMLDFVLANDFEN